MKLRGARIPLGSVDFFRAYLSMVLSSFLLYRLSRGEEFLEECRYTIWRKRLSQRLSFKEYCIQLVLDAGLVAEKPSSKTRVSGNLESTEEMGGRSSLMLSDSFSPVLKGERKRRSDFAVEGSPGCKMRLDSSLGHELISLALKKGGRSKYCAMCSVTVYKRLPNGGVKTLGRKGRRIVTFCSICRVHLCKNPHEGATKSCFAKWHSQKQLKLPLNDYA